jgi:hypothetical protein
MNVVKYRWRGSFFFFDEGDAKRVFENIDLKNINYPITIQWNEDLENSARKTEFFLHLVSI